MVTLFIDTHSSKLHLALLVDGVVKREIIRDDREHSTYFVSLLDEIMKLEGLSFEDLSDIILINGPGSFTGVRLGVVVAKLISYTKDIPIHTITYLEALALKYDYSVTLGIKDKNGVFIGTFDNNHECIGDYVYLTNKEQENYPKKIIIEDEIDLDRVYEYLKAKPSIIPHEVKPIYVKKIEVEND